MCINICSFTVFPWATGFWFILACTCIWYWFPDECATTYTPVATLPAPMHHLLHALLLHNMNCHLLLSIHASKSLLCSDIAHHQSPPHDVCNAVSSPRQKIGVYLHTLNHFKLNVVQYGVSVSLGTAVGGPQSHVSMWCCDVNCLACCVGVASALHLTVSRVCLHSCCFSC